MGAGAVALSFVLVEVDVWIGIELNRKPGWFLTFGSEGARAILAAIASSMITLAGLTFSLTMLTLQLASSQFGPRTLRSFLGNRGNQVVLGTFISTFIYCLLVLRTVRGTEGAGFVPHLSVAAGFGLAIASLAVLIYFIHHTAHAIRVESVLARMAEETRAGIERLYPAEVSREPSGSLQGDSGPSSLLPDFDRDGRAIPAARSGYVQIVNDEVLIALATRHDVVLRVDSRPGRFVRQGGSLITAAPAARISDELVGKLQAGAVVGSERTPRQDLAFSLNNIVEVAQRALSPGINDPTTARYCIDRLGEVLDLLAERRPPAAVRLDTAGAARVVTEAQTLGDLALPALKAVARYATADVDVIDHLLAMIEALAIKAPEERRSLLALATALRSEAQRKAAAFDRMDLDPRGGLVGAGSDPGAEHTGA